MILEKTIKAATNRQGYILLNKKQAEHKAQVIVDKQIIKESENKTKIYLKKEYIGLKAYVYLS